MSAKWKFANPNDVDNQSKDRIKYLEWYALISKNGFRISKNQ